MLSDTDIRHWLTRTLVITPLHEKAIQPASVDLRLSNQFRVFKSTGKAFIDPLDADLTNLTSLVEIQDRPFILHPGELVLGSTVEHFSFPHNIVGMLGGKSGLARLGLLVHATAGFFDPGFRGNATLEFSNVSRIPIALTPGMWIAQMSFMFTATPATNVYGSDQLGSHYQDNEGPNPSAGLSHS